MGVVIMGCYNVSFGEIVTRAEKTLLLPKNPGLMDRPEESGCVMFCRSISKIVTVVNFSRA